MLVLARKTDEKIIIANQIAVQVVRISRENVKLGIDAPSHIKVQRDEIHADIARENPAEVKPQIPSKDTLEALAQVEELAGTLGMSTSELLREMIRRFSYGEQAGGE